MIRNFTQFSRIFGKTDFKKENSEKMLFRKKNVRLLLNHINFTIFSCLYVEIQKK